jgi:60 kDa SS-A/Ro ribonucleoprotein
MKDMAAYLLAILMTVDMNLFKICFSRVVDNGKMLRNFVKVVRSGKVGRKSFGSAPRKLIRTWLENRKDEALFDDSVGNDPSLKDIIKMIHPKPSNQTRDNLYAYLIDKDVKNFDALPTVVQSFEAFKKANKNERTIPNINFQHLTALDLSNEEWKQIAANMNWHTLRMNINTLERHQVLNDPTMVDLISDKLADAKEIKKIKSVPVVHFLPEHLPNHQSKNW